MYSLLETEEPSFEKGDQKHVLKVTLGFGFKRSEGSAAQMSEHP
jgi:hypothetical protein